MSQPWSAIYADFSFAVVQEHLRTIGMSMPMIDGFRIHLCKTCTGFFLGMGTIDVWTSFLIKETESNTFWKNRESDHFVKYKPLLPARRSYR